jgi:hypothetical protein
MLEELGAKIRAETLAPVGTRFSGRQQGPLTTAVAGEPKDQLSCGDRVQKAEKGETETVNSRDLSTESGHEALRDAASHTAAANANDHAPRASRTRLSELAHRSLCGEA